MNSREVVALTRYVKALCPAQKFDEYTADVWTSLFSGDQPDVTLEQCRAVADYLARSQQFIAPHEILAELKRERAAQTEAIRAREMFTQLRRPRRQGEPPADWTEMRRDLGLESRDSEERKREIAREQVAESRKGR